MSASGRLLRGAGILTAAMLVANASNYLVNVVVARWTDPAVFADAGVLVTVFLVTGAGSLTLQLSTAGRAARSSGPADARTRRMAARTGWIAAAVGLAVAGPISGLLRMTTSVPLVLFALTLPAMIELAVDRGELQGKERFGDLARNVVVEAGCRLTVTVIGLALIDGVVAVAAALGISVWLARWDARVRVGPSGSCATDRPDARLLAAPVAVLLVGQLLVNNADIMLVKRWFDAEEAGLYNAVALVGRLVFFTTWSVVLALFPEAARRDPGHSAARSTWVGLGTVAALSGVLTVVVAVLSPVVLPVVLGPEYGADSVLLGGYALATSCFAITNLVATLDVARGSWRGPVLVGGLAVLQIGAISVAHSDLRQVVAAQVLCMSAGAALSVGWLALAQRRSSARSSETSSAAGTGRASRPTSPGTAGPVPATTT